MSCGLYIEQGINPLPKRLHVVFLSYGYGEFVRDALDLMLDVGELTPMYVLLGYYYKHLDYTYKTSYFSNYLCEHELPHNHRIILIFHK